MSPSDRTPLDPPLSGVRVIECGDTIAAAYAGRLFADLGAEVVKLEHGDGDPLRSIGPFPEGRSDRGGSAAFAYYHAGKQSVLFGGPDSGDAAEMLDLVCRADVLVRSSAAGEDWIPDHVVDSAVKTNPGLITVDISTLGYQSGDRSTSDLLALALSGLLSLNDSVGPLRYRGELACVHAACDGVLAALGALHVREHDGMGQRIDISAQAAVASILATSMCTYSYTGRVPRRDDAPPVAPWGYYACADGMALLQVTENAQWVGLRRVLGDPDWARDPRYEENAGRIIHHERLDESLCPDLGRFELSEFLEACVREGVPATHVHDSGDVISWEQLAHREFLRRQPVDGDGSTQVLVPGVPWRFARTPEAQVPSAPAGLGSTAMAGVASSWSLRQPRAKSQQASGEAAPEPLDNCRVLDLTWVWAGPFGTLQLAHLGADVIKVESTERVDVTRQLAPFADGEAGVDRSGYFSQYSQGKRSVSVDLKQAPGMGIVKELLARSDVLIDNMRPGALARMGLEQQQIDRIAPSVVTVALTGFGEDGPDRDRMAYGSIIDALAGVAAANGRPGGPPVFFPMSLPDPCAGIHAAIASTAALWRARRTGEGDRVELSMAETTLAAFPWPVLIEGSGGGPVVGEGNRDPAMAPHGVFATRGDDRWVAIVVYDDAEFRALATCIGQPELADDPRFVDLDQRKAHEDELEQLVADWMVAQERDQAVALLADAGVRAAPVLDVAEVMASDALADRDFVIEHEHPVVGIRPLPGVAWNASRSQMRVSRAAPCLGADTESVLVEVLGMSHDQVQGLDEQGVLK